MKKTIFYLMLLFVVLLVPVVATASGDVAKVNDTQYATLQEAINAAGTEGTVTLLSEVNLTEKIVIEKDQKITLDLAGNTLNLADLDNYAVVVKGDLTITGNGIVNANGAYGIGTSSETVANITVENGTFNSTGHYLFGAFSGKVIINGGTFNVEECVVNAFDGYTCSAEINGGIFNSKHEDWTVLGNSKVNGGTFNQIIDEAYLADGANVTYKLTGATNLTQTLEITNGTNVTLDLNGQTLTMAEKQFIKVNGGSLNVIGTGLMTETAGKEYYAPIRVYGSDDVAATKYSNVTVGSGVTLQGWTGIMLNQTSDGNAFGINIDFNGTINTVIDATGFVGSGIYANGTFQQKTNYPVINIGSTAKINSKGFGIILSGYGHITVNGATINAETTGIGIKSGKLTLNNANVNSTGKYVAEVEGNGNGINASGAAIQIESNNGYAGDMEISINGGTYTSANGVAIYEYLDKRENTNYGPAKETKVKSLVINGGKFISADGKEVFDFSDKFNSTITKFVNGGLFSSDVENYVAEGLTVRKNDLYEVGKLYNVTVPILENGKVEVNVTEAFQGDTITFDITANDDYEVTTYSVVNDSTNEAVALVGKTFIMPESDVTINAVISRVTTLETVTPTVDTTKEVEEVIVGVTNVDETKGTLLETLFGNSELVELSEKADLEIKVDIQNVGTSEEYRNEVLKEAKKEVENIKLSQFMDITIRVINKDTGEEVTTLSTLVRDIELIALLPEELKEAPEGYTRTYYVVLDHEGEIQVLSATKSEDGNSLNFKSKLYSTYAIAYVDVKKETSGDGGVDTPKDEGNKNEGTTNEDINAGTIVVPATPQPEGEKENPNIPNTGDNIITYVILAVIATAGLVIVAKLKKVNNKRK